MEKLLELLNEYKETKKIRNYDMDGQLEIDNAIYVNYPNIERLCGKQFGFIKWLVENKKIDIFKSGIDELPRMFGYDYESVECKSDRLVMMLSIQNEPIEYLISILK